jgi:branched-chain amino acid transport system ATP-binding protein
MLRLDEFACGYGPFRAVHALDMTVAKGEIFALLGPNGAGKTSTIMCLAGHVALQAGSVVFEDRDLSVIPAASRVNAGLALVPEGRRLFPDLTVEENLIVGSHSQPANVFATDRDRVVHYFPRLGERLRQPAGRLSGGEQQMLAIGRALMAHPRLLMVDELSLGLMPKAIDTCYEVLRRLARTEGLAVLMVDQSTDRALAVADAVCVMESGRVRWSGTGDDARTKADDVRNAIFGTV